MPTVDEELRAYAVKVSDGQATERDNQRIHQIGAALKKELPIPPAAVPVVTAPAPDPNPNANGRSGMAKGKPLLSKGKKK